MVWKSKEGLSLYVFGGIIVLLMLSTVAAALFKYNTHINIETTSEEYLVVRFRDADSGDIFKSTPTKTDLAGRARVDLATDREGVEVLVVYIMNESLFLQEDNIIKTEEAGIFSTSGPITINLNEPAPVVANETINETEEAVANETINETEEVEESEEVLENETGGAEEESKIVSFVIFGEDGILSGRRLYYLSGALFVLIIGYILLKVMKKNFRVPEQIGIGNMHGFSAEKEISKAEENIKEAQEELRKVKNEEKIKDAEKKIEEDKEKLEKLERGEE